MEALAGISKMTVRQRGTLGEAFTGFERKNYYDVTSASGEVLFNAEEAGSDYSMGKQVFEQHRTFQINVKEPGGDIVLRCVREGGFGEAWSKMLSGQMPYRSMEVLDARANVIGSPTANAKPARRIPTNRSRPPGHTPSALYLRLAKQQRGRSWPAAPAAGQNAQIALRWADACIPLIYRSGTPACIRRVTYQYSPPSP